MKFGPYIVGATLGEGEFGKVKMGWSTTSSSSGKITEDSKQVAIKLIRRDFIKKGSEKEMKIFREINSLKHLTHPNIVRLEEVLQNSKYIGIVLEYASGGEFYKYVQRKRRLKEATACRLFAQLISGVSYMHSKGIVHRDLKLENLLLDKHENLIITDFGFVNEFYADNELMKTSCGSPCYAAPELVITTEPYKARKADIWSCGIILYGMLAGYLPWDDDKQNPNGEDIVRLYHYITKTPLKFPEYITPLPRDLLRHILVSNPVRRMSSRHIKKHEWLSPHSHFLSITSEEWDNIYASKEKQKLASTEEAQQPQHHNISARASYTQGTLPSRMISTTDQFTKQIAVTSSIRSVSNSVNETNPEILNYLAGTRRRSTNRRQSEYDNSDIHPYIAEIPEPVVLPEVPPKDNIKVSSKLHNNGRRVRPATYMSTSSRPTMSESTDLTSSTDTSYKTAQMSRSSNHTSNDMDFNQRYNSISIGNSANMIPPISPQQEIQRDPNNIRVNRNRHSVHLESQTRRTLKKDHIDSEAPILEIDEETKRLSVKEPVSTSQLKNMRTNIENEFTSAKNFDKETNKKRFSFLSFVSPKDSDSNSNSELNNISSNARSDRSHMHPKPPMTYADSKSTRHPPGSRKTSSQNRNVSSNQTRKQQLRSSIMVSALPMSDLEAQWEQVEKNGKEQSTARRVLDFFKRRSMRI